MSIFVNLAQKIWVLFIIFLLNGTLQAQELPFSKGVNLTSWFQADNAQEIQFNRYSKQDFENIKSLGCDVIRLPINLHGMTDGAPDYTLDPLFVSFLNQAVDWAEDLEIHLILDNHSFDPAGNTQPSVVNILTKVWPQMAALNIERSERILYEVLNEPYGIDHATWNDIQGQVIEAIRAVDDKHTIVVGGADWNSYNSLAGLPAYDDDNLIYTFHFYDPFLFTHQGASWVGDGMEALTDMPFPYAEEEMPDAPPEIATTWIGNAFNNYEVDGTEQAVKELIDIAADFMETRNVPVFCGEFGVYQPNSEEQDRVYWYEVVRSYLEEVGIAWTIWDYKGGFGIFNEGGQDLFDHDFNIPMGEALGFNVPTQTPFEIMPDLEGQLIYDDFIGAGIERDGYQVGSLNFYSNDTPNYGDYCINWTEGEQYNQIGLNFVPDRDFSFLVENNYLIDFFVRSDQPWQQTQFDLRFVDTKTDDPEDHPWRMRILVNAELGDGDSKWKRIRVPLKDFSEHGSWDNNQWYEPQGLFDWAAVDRLEIVLENGGLGDANLSLDHIAITNVDTAMVNDPVVINSLVEPFQNEVLSIWPNPTEGLLNIRTEFGDQVEVEIMTGQGVLIKQFSFRGEQMVDLSALISGIYFLRIKSNGEGVESKRLLIIQN